MCVLILASQWSLGDVVCLVIKCVCVWIILSTEHYIHRYGWRLKFFWFCINYFIKNPISIRCQFEQLVMRFVRSPNCWTLNLIFLLFFLKILGDCVSQIGLLCVYYTLCVSDETRSLVQNVCCMWKVTIVQLSYIERPEFGVKSAARTIGVIKWPAVFTKNEWRIPSTAHQEREECGWQSASTATSAAHQSNEREYEA